jgi:hypothetical protein
MTCKRKSKKHRGGKVTTSYRLKKYLPILADMLVHTSAELQRRTGSMAVHSDISDLRKNGVPVADAVYLRTDAKTGRKIYGYYLYESYKIVKIPIDKLLY